MSRPGTIPRRALALLLAASLLGAVAPGPAAAEEIGRVVRLVPQVVSYPPGGRRDLLENDPVERGLRVELKPGAYLKVAFNFRGMPDLEKNVPWIGRIEGTATMRGGTEIELGDGERPSESRLKMTRGWLVLALLSGVASAFEVETPHAVGRAEGTYFQVFVDPEVGTFLAVDEGTVVVQAAAGGEPVRVTAGHWVLVAPGRLPTRPTPLPDDDDLEEPPLLDCCSGIQPPKPPGSPQ